MIKIDELTKRYEDDIFRAKIIADRVGIMKQGRLVAIRKRQDFKNADLEEI